MAFKQVILVRIDLKLPKGKLSAQVAHASLEAALKSSFTEKWRYEGAKKVVLKVSDQAELGKFESLARLEKVSSALIVDAGHTVLEPGTVTCLGIGPDSEEKIDRITGSLKML